MVQSNLLLASLIGSRICHDLISPVGAINNGLELLAMGGGGPSANSPELDLIGQSVTNANARIRFFRIAFGMTSSKQMLGAAEIRSILVGVYSEGRIKAEWHEDSDLPRNEVQAAFLALLCCESALPLGGDLSVHIEDSTWIISGTGRKTKIDPPLWETVVSGEPHEIQPSEVQFLMLPACLKALNCRATTTIDSEEITIRF